MLSQWFDLQLTAAGSKYIPGFVRLKNLNHRNHCNDGQSTEKTHGGRMGCLKLT